jgi:hypothetical protein
METIDSRFSTGIASLDRVLKGINAGDNIVWEIQALEDYADLVRPYAECAVRNGHKLIYFRFASHAPLLGPGDGAEIHEFRPEDGFEPFVDRIHAVIRRAGRGAFYVFDCLSELAADWYSDQMLGNFFMLTCPFLFDLETITYFALFHGGHSDHAVRPILETTQLYLEVHRCQGTRYIRPVKVQHRYSSTMHMLHAWEGEDVRLVNSSARIADVLAASPRGLDLHAEPAPGPWGRAFREVVADRERIRAGQAPVAREAELRDRLARMVMTRDERLLPLIARWLTLDDLLAVGRRMIGTGLIGGKAAGMLLARAILQQSRPRFRELLEQHDSFFIGSDVFCTYLVRNGVWWLRQRQRDPETFLEGAEQARRRILTGNFPAYTLREFEAMLDYFGQSPFIVRSSSLLEDSFGSAFAGKYESVFCANQGPRERRLEDFLAAVRTVYASAMGERALRYRAERGLLGGDEQMALLVMRVSGTLYGRHFYPAVAGVGFSYNPYVWNPEIDPQAGVVRLVFGLGTRAVNRSDDDYTRLVALNAPMRRPEANFDDICQYAQRKMDFIDLEANRLVSEPFQDVTRHVSGLPMNLFVSEQRLQSGDGPTVQALTFDGLLQDTPFVEDLRAMLGTLQEAYRCPVDVEFTANMEPDGRYQVNPVQCRPLQVRGTESVELPRVEAAPDDRVIEARGAVVGHSRVSRVDRFVYVVPERYGELPVQDRHEVARLLGRLNRVAGREPPGAIMLIGPGRWGTSSPELGIPVAFAEISRASVICEVVAMRKDLIPDVSLGTHFLNELVEMDMLYLALFPQHGQNRLDEPFFTGSPNRLLELVPDAERWQQTVRVVDARDVLKPGEAMMLVADAVEQKVICYRDRGAAA